MENAICVYVLILCAFKLVYAHV